LIFFKEFHFQLTTSPRRYHFQLIISRHDFRKIRSNTLDITETTNCITKHGFIQLYFKIEALETYDKYHLDILAPWIYPLLQKRSILLEVSSDIWFWDDQVVLIIFRFNRNSQVFYDFFPLKMCFWSSRYIFF
jgi:hypothetical protein